MKKSNINKAVLLLLPFLLLTACNSSKKDESGDTKETEQSETVTESETETQTETETESESETETETETETESETETETETETEEELKPGEEFVPFKMKTYFTGGDNDYYDLKAKYSDNYFAHDADVFSIDLARLSFVASVTTYNKQILNAFYTGMGFDNISISASYDSEPTVDSIGYVFGHKKIGDYDLIGVTIRGFNYKAEWANNFLVGSENNHEGFSLRAKEVQDALLEYVKSYSNLKLWISGFSRGGAIADIVGNNLSTSNDLSLDKKNIYVYTIEAPASLVKEEAEAGNKNIFDICNPADIVSSVPPAEYGLYRPGVEINIYDEENFDSLIKKFDKNIELPEFDTGDSQFKNDADFKDQLIASLLQDSEAEDYQPYLINTRERYATNAQAHIMYVIGLAMSLKASTIEAIKADIQDKMENDFMALLGLLGEDGLYNYLEVDNSFLKDDGVTYDSEVLKEHLHFVNGFIPSVGGGLLTALMSYTGNAQRMIEMHYPETSYILLKNYNPEA